MAERPDAFEQMRLILRRQRDAGVPFDVAWKRALGALPQPEGGDTSHPAREARAAFAALGRTEEEWRLAYERLPAPPRPYPQPWWGIGGERPRRAA